MTDPAGYLADLAEATAELERVTLTSFTDADAWQIATWSYAAATERGYPLTIDIRRGKRQIFRAAAPGSTADNDAWVERKVRAVERFEMASYRLGQLYTRHLGGFHEATALPPSDFAASGGCVPILVHGVGVVGTFAVSGLPEEMDHDFVIEALEWHAGRRADK